MGFVHTLSSIAKIENRLRLDKVPKSLKVGTLFETQCNTVETSHSTYVWSGRLNPH